MKEDLPNRRAPTCPGGPAQLQFQVKKGEVFQQADLGMVGTHPESVVTDKVDKAVCLHLPIAGLHYWLVVYEITFSPHQDVFQKNKQC